MFRRWLTTLIAISILLSSPSPALLAIPALVVVDTPTPTMAEMLFRTTVTLRQLTDHTRLDQLGAVVLSETGDHAIVLVDADQLDTLARLRFEPSVSDDVVALVTANAPSRPWLADSLQSLLAQAKSTQAVVAKANATAKSEAYASLRAMVQALSPEQRAGLNALSAIDDDGDGLTNTQEQWWCTDPNNPDSDNDGVSDYAEVTAVKDWLANRRSSYPASKTPYNSWPMVPGDANFNASCIDHDQDVVPDAAETWELGLNPNRESTSGDKFDDGQKLFGLTKVGWGPRPGLADNGFIVSEMPSFVKAPGNHPFVAAYPVPEISVVAGSWHVNRVTTITTQQGTMTQASKTYGSSVTRGTSDSIANSVTWNNWEEVSQAVSTPLGHMAATTTSSPNTVAAPNFNLGKFTWGASTLVSGGFSFAGGCTAGAALMGTIGSIVPVAGTAIGATVGCIGVGLAASYANLKDGFTSVVDSFKPDDAQKQTGTNQYGPSKVTGTTTSATAQASVVVNNNIDTSGVVNSLDGVQYAINQQGALMAQGLHDVAYAISQPRLTETHTNGHSWGGAQTTTHTEIEEHTLSESQAFTTGENWSTAWAVDSSHAADLTFNYTIKNTGTEYAREITGIIFNVYLGDDANPIVSYPVNQTFQNVFPYPTTNIPALASSAIPLTLDQMKRIDLGEQLTVVLANYSYGADQVFYQNAVDGGVTLFTEGGTDDASEQVDSYVIPTWGDESVQAVLTRYFPHDIDVDGLLNSLSTPTFSNNVPTWHAHALSDIAWWNVYLSQADAGNTELRDLPAQAGSALFFHFNRDSDRDGYPDRAEKDYYCALPQTPTNAEYCATAYLRAEIHPQPELLAGYATTRVGNVVTATLALDNAGTFDAYHISAVMVSPDESTTIGNNTVGGNGRVRPGRHVAVGSLIKEPGLANWGSNTSKVYSTGDYGGALDRTYTFNVSTPGVVGQGTAAMTWNDGAGVTGTLALGASYHAPLPLDVAQGLQVGFNTGTLNAGTLFTVTALSPRDTFTYTINSEPFTLPVVIVGYSDPQGAHRFVTPAQLPDLQVSLVPTYTGQMLTDVGLSIATTAPVTTGLNTTNFILNNPAASTIVSANLYVDFVSNGALMLHLPHTLTLNSGPTVYSAAWATSQFSQTYDATADNILIAHWTDSEGNILDSAARPLNTFAADPVSAFAMGAADQTWNFGTVTQGEVLQHTFTFASIGSLQLLSYLGNTSGMTITGATSRQLSPADTATYTVTLDTTTQSTGAFSKTLILRTSDPANPTHNLNIVGTISAPSGAANAFDVINRPWDKRVLVYGNVAQYSTVDFNENIQPDSGSIEPCKVYSADGTALKGIGKVCADFGGGVSAGQIFGDGHDGDLIVNAGQTAYPNTVRAAIISQTLAGSSTVFVDTTASFNPGDEVMLMQTQGDLGYYEFGQVLNIQVGQLTLRDPLLSTYSGLTGSITGLTCNGGFYGEYFANQTLSGSPSFAQCDSAINFGWGEGSPGGGLPNDHFSIRWTANFSLPTGNYVFTSCMDDGIRFYIDNNLLIDQWHDHAGYCENVRPYLSAGVHSLKLEYFEDAGGTLVNFAMSRNPVRGQVVKVPHFRNVNVAPTGRVMPIIYDGTTGGLILFRASGQAYISGTVDVTGAGYRGGVSGTGAGNPGASGEGLTGPSFAGNSNNGQGGGGGSSGGGQGGADGGGGSLGDYGTNGSGGDGDTSYGGVRGALAGAPDFSTLSFGGGGGAGGYQCCWIEGQYGGSGGGIAAIFAHNLMVSGTIQANGQNGKSGGVGPGSGGAGAGGSVYIKVGTAELGGNRISALGGLGASGSGNGGAGRIRLEYCDMISGTTTPVATIQKITCYIAEKLSDTLVHFTVPDAAANGQNYVMQFGRRFVFGVGGGSTMTPTRLLAQNYANATMDALITNVGAGGATNLQVQVGTQTVYSAATTITQPTSISISNFAGALNAYLASQPANTLIDVPMTVTLNRQADVMLTNLVLTPGANVDVAVTAGDIAFGATSPTEGARVPITVTLHNTGNTASSGLTAAFFATPTLGSAFYIGSAYVPNIPTNGTAQATIQWNTLGFTGTTPVRVIVDPYNRMVETNETNNSITSTLNILTRPDLAFTSVALSNDEPVVTETVIITVALHNSGQTSAGAESIALYQGNPDSGGVLIGAQAQSSLAGDATRIITFTWTPTSTGAYRLFARADRNGQITEADESNNDRWQDVYVGLRGPILLDSGAASDVPYTTTLGYGYVDDGLPGTTSNCGTQPYQTLRLDTDRQITYRFDHLQPGHFYHLDVTLYKCAFSNRRELINVDGATLAGPIDLSDGKVHRVSTLLDPAFYQPDRSISATIAITGSVLPALVNEVNLYDVDYRYADAGGDNDPPYPGTRGFGWLNGDGLHNDPLPAKSLRLNPLGDQVQYRFDHLQTNKNYQIKLSFWQPAGSAPVTQKIQIDGLDVSAPFIIDADQSVSQTLDVPIGLYSADGSIVIGVVRTDASDSAFVNEIALEELTAVLPPIANFAATTPVSGLVPLSVQFNDLSSGAITARLWRFGDGATSTLTNPLHTYPLSGTYSVNLQITGPGGSDAYTRTNYITARDPDPNTIILRVATPANAVSAGATVTVPIVISNVTNLGSFQFTLAYSPSLVTVQAVTLGEFPGSTGRTFNPLGPVIDNSTGSTTFGASSLGALPAGPTGSGTLAYVRLIPQQAGTAQLKLSAAQASDVPGSNLPLIKQDGLLSIVNCLGDFNNNGIIDANDIQQVAYRWNMHLGQPLYDARYDVDPLGAPDGDIDILDVQRVAYRWNMTCSAAYRPIRLTTTSPITFSIQPAQRTVTAGQTLTVAVAISNALDLGAFEYTLAYSPTMVEVVTATLAAFPGSTGRSFIATGPVVSPTAGTLNFGAYSLGATPPGAIGDGLAAIITLRALAAGNSGLIFQSVQASDRIGNAQTPATALAGQVTITLGHTIYLPLVRR